jgi:Protein of unknown function (DUF2505)
VTHNVGMQLSARHEFAASCDRVYAMSIDPAFLARACTDLGATSQTTDVCPGPDASTTRVSVEVETPSQLAALAGPSITVGQEMAWGGAAPDGSRLARLLIKVAGFPVAVDATARLAPTASGCAIDYAGTLTVKVPLLGPALEKQAAPFVLETLDIQQHSGNAWLQSM